MKSLAGKSGQIWDPVNTAGPTWVKHAKIRELVHFRLTCSWKGQLKTTTWKVSNWKGQDEIATIASYKVRDKF